MKKFWLVLLLASPVFSQESQEQEAVLKDLSGGLVTNISANKIPDNAAAYIQNFVTDFESVAIERNGYVKRDATVLGGTKAVYGLWDYTDTSGNQWIISYSSRTYYKNTIGQTPTAFGPIATTDQIPDAATNLGVIMFVNGTDSAWTFNGTATATVAGAPLGTHVEAWRTRFAISNIGGAKSTVRFSEDGSATNWVLGGNPTDPFSILVGGANDGEYVRCLIGTYLDSMIIGRKYDLWALDGFDQGDVLLRNISDKVGCIEPRTPQEVDGELVFLSARGLEAMNAREIRLISEPVRDIVDTIVKNTANQRNNLQSSQGDWEAGTQSPTGFAFTSRSPGDLEAGTTSWTVSTVADWNTGTITGDTQYVDTTTVSGSIQTVFPEPFNTLRDGTAGTLDLWTEFFASDIVSCSNSVSGGILTITGSSFAGATRRCGLHSDILIPHITYGTTVQIKIEDIDNNSANDHQFYVLLNTSNTTTVPASGTYFGFRVNRLTATTPDVYQFSCVSNDPGVSCGLDTVSTAPFTASMYISTSNWQFVFPTGTYTGTHSWGINEAYLYLSGDFQDTGTFNTNISSVAIVPQSFSHVSSTFNTGFVNPVQKWDKFYPEFMYGAGTTTVSLQISTDSISWDTGVLTSSAVVPNLSQKQYLRSISSIAITDVSQSSPTGYGGFTFGGYSSGVYTSQLISVGSLITSWGPVTISDVQNGGSIVYQFGSTNTASVSAISNWASIVNGGIPSVSTNPYAAFRSTMTPLTSTASVKTSDFQTTWNEGGVIPSPVSGIYDRRYWMSYTTSTASSPALDSVLVWQRNKSFTLFKGINAGSFTNWMDNFYFGNSNATGYVYKYDVGNNDDGFNIASTIHSKSYDLGASYRDKNFRNTYLQYLANTSFSGTFSVSYDLDRLGQDFSLGSINMNEGIGQLAVKLPFSFQNPVQGREIQYRITKVGTGDRLRLYDIAVKYSLEEEQ